MATSADSRDVEAAFRMEAGDPRMSQMSPTDLRARFEGGSMTSEETGAMMRNLTRTHYRADKYKSNMYILVAAALALAALVGGMFVVTASAVENAKESHVEGSTMVGLDGMAVQTEALTSYGKLEDLPSFDGRTLETVKSLQLKLKNGGEVAFTITGYHRTAATKVQFLTPGGSVTVDSLAGVATASVNGALFEVSLPAADATSTSSAVRRLAGLGPRLFTEEEFFGTGHGRSLAAGTAGGWATLAIQAAKAVLAEFAFEGSPAVSGTVTAKGMDEKREEVTLNLAFHITEGAKQYTMIASDTTGSGHRVVFTQMFVAWGEVQNGVFNISKCAMPITNMELTDSQHKMYGGGVSDLNMTLIGEPKIDETTTALTVPGVSNINIACQNWMSQGLSGRTNRRRMSAADYVAHIDAVHPEGHPHRRMSLENVNLAAMVYEAPPSSDYELRIGEGYQLLWGTAHNRVMWQKGTCKFAFAGTDEFMDWLANAQVLNMPYGPDQINVHIGFAGAFDSVRPFIDNDSGCDCYTDTCAFYGHSLGGAIAEMARVWYGKGAVYTYGKPKAHGDKMPDFVQEGQRIFHEDDPVAGPMFGVNAHNEHNSVGMRLSHNCGRSWYGVLYCEENKVFWEEAGFHEGSPWHAASVAMHGMDNYRMFETAGRPHASTKNWDWWRQ